MEFLLDGIRAVTPQQCVMYVVGALLIYLAIKKDYEPSLLLPMGFGAILVNLPMSGVLNQMVAGVGESQGIIQWLFETTIEASEALPLLLFIGIGAMKPAMIVTMMGKQMRSVRETCLGLYGMCIARSFLVVTSLMANGWMIGTSAMYE